MVAEGFGGGIQVARTLVIHQDCTWHVCLERHRLSSGGPLLSALPQYISSLADIRAVIEFLDSCVACSGNIVADNSHVVADSYPPGSFGRIFWESQERAASLKNARSMRWDPLMIRWCLYLRHLSSSAYEMVRESGVIKLPSQRTLRDYTYHTKATIGFSAEVDEHLMEAAKIDSCPERERYVILIMDEMHVKEGVVYDKHTGNLLKFDKLHNHVLTLDLHLYS